MQAWHGLNYSPILSTYRDTLCRRSLAAGDIRPSLSSDSLIKAVRSVPADVRPTQPSWPLRPPSLHRHAQPQFRLLHLPLRLRQQYLRLATVTGAGRKKSYVRTMEAVPVNYAFRLNDPRDRRLPDNADDVDEVTSLCDSFTSMVNANCRLQYYPRSLSERLGRRVPSLTIQEVIPSPEYPATRALALGAL